MEGATTKPDKLETLRHVVAILAILITLYYLYWRVTETFNTQALFFSWALYCAEVFGAVTTFLFYFMVWKLKVREPLPPLENRTVDVLIPTKSESMHVLRKTLLGCRNIKYPHRTLVLDDGDRPELKELCDELGCVYLARPEHTDAKAGNLNYGLQHSTAEFIAAFDADHIPLPHFVDRLIGYFGDEKVAFVQTPQEFYNTDSFQHRVDKKRKYIWGEQYLFFSLIQPGKDRWNSAYFVGSCALLRRTALDEVGGFATGTITEDMLTSLRIHAKKWSSIYHNENLAYGIAAESIHPFHVQRQRWGVGNWQILFKSNPFLMRGLTIPQRINYMASMIYPLEGFQKIIFYVTPPISIFTGVLPMRSLDINYLIHFVPYFLITIVGFNEMSRGYGGQLMLEQFSMAKYYTYIKSVWLFFFPRLRKQFKVTPKGDQHAVPSNFIIPQMIVFIISLTAIVYAVVEELLGERTDNFIIAVNCFWALYNSGLAAAIIQYDYKKLFQRRTNFRIPDVVPCVYVMGAGEEGGKKLLAVTIDLTEDGASLVIIGQVLIGSEVRIHFMLPQKTVGVKGVVVQQKSIDACGYAVSCLGIRFIETPAATRDFMTNYLYESAISKFMKEYSTQYKTYLEKRFNANRHFNDRAYRALAYLPIVLRNGPQKQIFGVLKDISETGILLATKIHLQQGSDISLRVVLGTDQLTLEGTVVRDLVINSEEFPEYMCGVKIGGDFRPTLRRILEITDKIGDFLQI